MGTIYNQPAGGEQLQSNGKKLRTLVTKGLYADQLTAANARPRGTHITDYGYVLSWNLQRVNGDLGICTYQLAAQTSEQWTSNEPLSETWSLKHIRVDVPIERYGGPSEVNSASLYDLARWQTEPDKTLYAAYKYKTDLDVIVELSSHTIELADKIKLGHEVVQRHFPVAVLTTLSTQRPASIGTGIDYIEEPDEFGDTAAEWLKIQDDVSQSGDGNWQRVQAWQGAEYWDQNFYGSGSSRWEFGTI